MARPVHALRGGGCQLRDEFRRPGGGRPVEPVQPPPGDARSGVTDWTGFAKLRAPLYAGFLLCVIGCLVPVHATTFAPRVTVLVASLFAIVINMRSASIALGEHGLTLIDELHVAGLAYVVAITAVTVLVRRRAEHAEHGEDDRRRLARLDHRSCIVPAALFAAANIALLLHAATEG